MSSATVKWKVLPTPDWLSSQICPPIRWTSVEEIARPSPVPPNLRVVDPSAWLKASKMCACLFSGMPMPVSVTENCSFVDPACLESSRTAITMRPRSVNLSALPTRLVSTCFSRTGSPTTALGRPGAMSVLISSPFFAAWGDSSITTSATAPDRPNAIDSSSSLRDSIFEKSRMSLRIVSNDSAESVTVPRQSF